MRSWRRNAPGKPHLANLGLWKEHMVAEVIDIQMLYGSMVEPTYTPHGQAHTLRCAVDGASTSICEDVNQRADLQEQGLGAHASATLATFLILEALDTNEHVVELVEDSPGHVELVVENTLQPTSHCKRRHF